MPKVIIDNIPVDAPEGTNILEAARQVGIVIPHFCWHPALGKAGACRVCAVKVLEGAPKGLQMSCMIPIQEGMVVSTTDPEAVMMRKKVIEWLMINHPHDCPVCDEGGECQLQDFTIAGGHGIRRYDGLKRTYLNQYLGEQIEHEMNRCIQCYRCARFYQEYAGGTDFGAMGRAAMVYFGRQSDGPLESPFSGNLVDICPTGVFTDKTARFRARYWDYEMAPSVCPGCSLGCNITPATRFRELLKIIGRRNEKVNDWFICDRGRFAKYGINSPERPRQPLVEGKPVKWEQALDALQERLSEFLELHGADKLAIVGSPRMSLEGNVMAARLRETLGAGILSFFTEESQQTQASRGLGARNIASMADVRQADLVVILADDLLEEAPMLALAARQAWRGGAKVFSVGGSAKGGIYDYTPIASISEVPLDQAKRPVIIGGRGADDLKPEYLDQAKVAWILPGPNAYACAMLAGEHGAQPLAEAITQGRIKGIISTEADIPTEHLAGVRVIAALDWQPTDVLAQAEVVLPATAWIEMDGIFINYEGRAQAFRRVMLPGVPVIDNLSVPEPPTGDLETRSGRLADRPGHPPHDFCKTPPGGEIHQGWQIIAAIIERLTGDTVETPLTGEWERLRKVDPEGGGELISPR